MTPGRRTEPRAVFGLAAILLVWLAAAPPVAQVTSTVVFSDGFEGGYGAWSRVVANGGSAFTSQAAAYAGTRGVRLGATSAAGSVGYVRRVFPTAYGDLTVASTVRILEEGPAGRVVPIMHILTRSGARVLSVYRPNGGAGRLYVSYAGAGHATSANLARQTWARIGIRASVSGASGTVLVTFNGQTVFSSRVANLGTVQLAGVQLGSSTAAQTFALDADAVNVTAPASTPCGTLQGRINAAPAGSILDLTGCTYASGGIVPKPLTIRGAMITVPDGMRGLMVEADAVTLDGLRIIGPQATAFDGGAVGIYAQGKSAAAPIGRLTIRNCEIANLGGFGVYLRYVVEPVMSGNRVHDIVYAGIKVDSGRGGRIEGNTVQRIGVVGSEANAGNAYGIDLEQVVNGDLTVNPVTADFVVSENTVEDVPTWHGLDTHAGQRITFSNNTVRRVMRALFITTDKDGRRPSDITVTGNQFLSPAPVSQNLAAVTLYRADRVTITGNTFVGWPAGREVYDYQNGSAHVLVSDNTIFPG